MKKLSIILLASLPALWLVFYALPLRADSNASFSLSGHYSRRVSGPLAHDNGLGCSLLLEFLPVESFSIGAGLGLTHYFGFDAPGVIQVESADLVSRVLFNPGEPWTFYLMLGGGLNPKVEMPGTVLWGGDYHLMGGLGVWCPLSAQFALDLGANYQYYNSPGDPLQAVQAKVGVGYFFNPAFKDFNPPTPTPTATITPTATQTAAATPTPTRTATPELPRMVTSKKGESLWDIAGRSEVYDDPELYPLLVDANRKGLTPIQISVKEGKKLNVPRDLSEAEIQKARKNAWKANYKKYRGRGLTRRGYLKWRKSHASAPVPAQD
jgi:hypothetical protein